MKKYKGVFLVLAAGMMWGTAGLFVRNLKALGLDTMHLVFNRAVFSLIILGALIFLKDAGLFKIKAKDLLWFAATGILSIVMFNFCYYKTMAYTSLSVAAVLLYTAPFFVVIMSTIFFKEKISARKIISVVCAFIGCCFVSGLFSGGNQISREGLFYGILTGFGYSLYTIFGNVLIKRGYKTLTITFYTFVFAAIGCMPFINVFEAVKVTVSGTKIFFITFLMALVNTVIPYLFYTAGLKYIESSKAPIIATVEPVVATIIGILVFKEALTLSGIIGIMLVLGSVVILNFKAEEVKIENCSESECKNQSYTCNKW